MDIWKGIVVALAGAAFLTSGAFAQDNDEDEYAPEMPDMSV